jgi:hypothetical protein
MGCLLRLVGGVRALLILGGELIASWNIRCSPMVE